MEVYLDLMPLANTNYILSIVDKRENAISLIGTDDRFELNYRGLTDIEHLKKGECFTTNPNKETECEITRIK